jgi:hypothetical protein
MTTFNILLCLEKNYLNLKEYIVNPKKNTFILYIKKKNKTSEVNQLLRILHNYEQAFRKKKQIYDQV